MSEIKCLKCKKGKMGEHTGNYDYALHNKTYTIPNIISRRCNQCDFATYSIVEERKMMEFFKKQPELKVHKGWVELRKKK